MEELNIDLEFQEKERFKNIIPEKNLKSTILWTFSEKKTQDIQDYLTETESDMNCEENKWLFKCQTDDKDLEAIFKWKYEQHFFISCKENIWGPASVRIALGLTDGPFWTTLCKIFLKLWCI